MCVLRANSNKAPNAAGTAMAVRVLLVEDLHNMHTVVLDLLNTVGEFQLAGAVATEAEAYLWLEENEGAWDLAILDLVLAQGTGLSVISRVSKTPGTQVAVFSDYVTSGIRTHCLAAGADAVFQKGVQTAEFLDWCARLAKDELGSLSPDPS
jgi:DNA-binding NarL/FixJ family response regulator